MTKSVFSLFICCFLQVFGHLVAIEVAVVEASCTHYDRMHLGCCTRFNHTVGTVLPASATESGFGHYDVHRSVAAGSEWGPLLSGGQCIRLLFGADATHFAVLHIDLDQGVAAIDSRRFEGCTNGTNATEIQNESCQNVICRCHIVCVVMVAALLDFRSHQIR